MIAFRILYRNDNVILLEDFSACGNNKSITNSAGDIVYYMQRDGYLYGQRLMYLDSDGVIDEIVYADGKDYIFRTFKIWNLRGVAHFCQRFNIPISRISSNSAPKYYHERV